ncbi:MA3 DOMAIN-CONTAINING TRANSLATION REGULATORY FACTOR 1-like [Wolffia australiana]
MASNNEGFLTGEQREVLKIAVQSAEGLSSSPRSPSSMLNDCNFKGSTAGSRVPSGVRQVRRSHSGKLVKVKKDGAGGKGTWGKLLDSADTQVDRNDPNYDSGEEPYKLVGSTLSTPVDDYKKAAVAIIREYFLCDDVEELVQSLRELAAPELNAVFVKKLVGLAMDGRGRDREMASAAITALRVELFSSEDVVEGFVMLLEEAEETALDVVDAEEELAFFLARAVVDETLAPLDLAEMVGRVQPGSRGCEILRTARALASARHAGERLLRCWGAGSGWAVEDAKDRISGLLEEYANGGDVEEACRCIRDMGMPFFGHEVVKKALVMAMEKRRAGDRVLDLLQECFEEGLLTTSQMAKGFSRVQDTLDDLALDVPDARDKFITFAEKAKEKGWISLAFEAS